MTDSIELLDLMLHLDERQGRQHAFISIRPNTRIHDPFDPGVMSAMIEKIREQVRERNIGHGLRKGSEIKEEIKRYLAGYDEIKARKTFFTFPLASPTPPLKGRDGSLEVLIDLKLKPGKIKNEKTGKIDYHDLGFSDKLIQAGTPIVIINHAEAGSDGTSIFNQPLKAQAGEPARVPQYDRKTVVLEDDPEHNRAVLKAGITGFLYHDGSRGYFIDKDVLTNQVDFTTGNIEIDDFSKVDSIIKVSGHRDIMRDSVKPGFTLKAREIIVDGNVGRGAHLEGEIITVTGIVDSRARIIGRKIEIGKAVGAHIEGDDIKINEVLQNAVVVGRQVRINICMSSHISGEDVFINQELRSGTVVAASFIYCNQASGSSHSSLIIDPLQIPSFKEKLAEQLEALGRLQKEHKELRDLYEKDLERHENQHLPKLKLFFSQVEEIKKVSFSASQKQALEQLVSHGRIDEIAQRLNFKIQSLTRNNLEKFAESQAQLRRSTLHCQRSRQQVETAVATRKALEESHVHGLILLNEESVGESRICYRDICLAPVVYNLKMLFCFNEKNQRILALKKFSPVTHRRLFEKLSPRALAVINKFS